MISGFHGEKRLSLWFHHRTNHVCQAGNGNSGYWGSNVEHALHPRDVLYIKRATGRDTLQGIWVGFVLL
ncbi:hypothetical protein DPMN_074418 [Dreissena polymorpha]|uniref:Uncharacterized protein n=1 Tax=Dreissena polymorpha TaxID=45954 RepID=A0A9D3YFB2_DREPO|nr:hypothetical protein DPMN_074418 [Dreissena polymorpha]